MFDKLLVCYALALLVKVTYSRDNYGGNVKSYDVSTDSKRGERGEKGYGGYHEHEKGEKGNFDIEKHQKQYGEEGGHKSTHNSQDDYNAGGYKGENGRRGYHYHDKGSYANGHSTKGHHNVHKSDEFKKEKEFFDEDHDEGNKEKHGSYASVVGLRKGGFELGGHKNNLHFAGEFGKSAEGDKKFHDLENSGYRNDKGTGEQFKDAEKLATNDGFEFYKLFGYGLRKGFY